jgi:hypothetical protein
MLMAALLLIAGLGSGPLGGLAAPRHEVSGRGTFIDAAARASIGVSFSARGRRGRATGNLAVHFAGDQADRTIEVAVSCLAVSGKRAAIVGEVVPPSAGAPGSYVLVVMADNGRNRRSPKDLINVTKIAASQPFTCADVDLDDALVFRRLGRGDIEVR